MNLFRLNIILFTIILSHQLKAQEITGIVRDGITKEALIGVNIILDGKGISSSDFDGKFKIKTSIGSHEIIFKFIGYKEEKINLNLSSNQIKNIVVEMNEDAELIKTVIVSAGKFEQRIEETTVSVEVIKPGLISDKNTTNIQTAIDQVPGVNITDGQANIRGGSGWSYGAGTRVQVLVDDMPLI